MNLRNEITGLIFIDLADKEKYRGWIDFYIVPFLEEFNFKCVINANYVSVGLPEKLKNKYNPIDLRTLDEFKEILEKNPDVTKWLIAGASWNMCVHYRNIGFVNLATLPNLEFYITTYSIFDDNKMSIISAEDIIADSTITWERQESPSRAFFKLINNSVNNPDRHKSYIEKNGNMHL